VAGLLILVLVTCFFLRRKHRRPYEIPTHLPDASKVKRQQIIEPFVLEPRSSALPEATGGIAGPSAYDGSLEKRTAESAMRLDDSGRKAVSLHEEIGADAPSPACTPPLELTGALTRTASHPPSGGQVTTQPVDLQRLFEDRGLEEELVDFLRQRLQLNLPRRSIPSFHFGEENPPLYQPS
jgi:hypothetical protein